MPDRPRRIPEATVTRLPIYLRILTDLGGERGATVSSERLAELAGVNAAKVRKDLSYLGSYGTRGVGYEVEYLLFQVSRELGLTQDWPVVIVGVGNLGRALADYAGFTSRGFPRGGPRSTTTAPRSAPSTWASPSGPWPTCRRVVVEKSVTIGVVATPPGAAQEVTDRLVSAGVTAILNFAPTVLTVPEGCRCARSTWPSSSRS